MNNEPRGSSCICPGVALGLLAWFRRGWHALRYSEGRGSSQGRHARPSEYLRACHPIRAFLNHAGLLVAVVVALGGCSRQDKASSTDLAIDPARGRASVGVALPRVHFTDI